jgi:hypothetical protein
MKITIGLGSRQHFNVKMCWRDPFSHYFNIYGNIYDQYIITELLKSD